MPPQGTEGRERSWTKGPWHYRPQKYDDWGVVRAAPTATGEQWLICQARDPLVYTEDQLNEHRRAGTDPWEANGHLIAAAPELFEALERLLIALSDDAHGRSASDHSLENAYEDARAALAQARNQRP